MVNLRFPPTPEQALGMGIVRMIMSVPSLIGSAYIVQHVLRSSQYKQTHSPKRLVFARIMLCMSSYDFVAALYTLTSAFALPAGAQGPTSPLAAGTWTTCEISGFVGELGRLTSILYNASLALYFLLTIRHQYSDKQILKIEPWFHAVPNAIGWGAAIAGVPLTLYNPTPMGCVMVQYPVWCDDNNVHGGDNECTRGHNARAYQLSFWYVWVWAVFLFLLWSMYRIYQALVNAERILGQSQIQASLQSTVAQAHISSVEGRRSESIDTDSRSQVLDASSCQIVDDMVAEKRDDQVTNSANGGMAVTTGPTHLITTITTGDSHLDQYHSYQIKSGGSGASTDSNTASTSTTTSGTNNSSPSAKNSSTTLKRSKMFATQAYLYCFAFFITFIFDIIQVPLIVWTTGEHYIPLVFLMYIFDPLQGFWNALIYIRPRYLACRLKQKQQDQNDHDVHQNRLKAFLYAASAVAVADDESDHDNDNDYHDNPNSSMPPITEESQ